MKAIANLDSGATVDTFLANFDREGGGDGSSYDWITDVEASHFQGYDEKDKPRSLNGEPTESSNASVFAIAPAASDEHKVRCSAAEIAYKEQQDFYVGHDGGSLSRFTLKTSQKMRIHFGKLLKRSLIPVYLEKGALNFYLNRGVKSEEIYSVNDAEQCPEKESSALVSPTKTLYRDAVPIGDDIDPVG